MPRPPAQESPPNGAPGHRHLRHPLLRGRRRRWRSRGWSLDLRGGVPREPGPMSSMSTLVDRALLALAGLVGTLPGRPITITQVPFVRGLGDVLRRWRHTVPDNQTVSRPSRSPVALSRCAGSPPRSGRWPRQPGGRDGAPGRQRVAHHVDLGFTDPLFQTFRRSAWIVTQGVRQGLSGAPQNLGRSTASLGSMAVAQPRSAGCRSVPTSVDTFGLLLDVVCHATAAPMSTLSTVPLSWRTTFGKASGSAERSAPRDLDRG